MKDLTKEELELLVRESNKDILDELSYEDEEGQARINTLEKYSDFISQVRFILLDNMMVQAKADYDHGVLNKSDIQHLIEKECNERLMLVASTLASGLGNIIGASEEEVEMSKGPIPLPPERD